MISIGIILGGGELAGSKVDNLISRICTSMPRAQDPDAMDINIVFHVPGSIVKPDYSGIRSGKFSAKKKILMVQVSVPEELMNSPGLEAFLDNAMVESIYVAKDFFQKKKIKFNESDYLKLIEKTKLSLRK